MNPLPCLQDLLTRHKAMVAVYLSEHYRSFFLDYSKLLQSSNYVTRRQSLKVSLLHTLLTNCGCHLLTIITLVRWAASMCLLVQFLHRHGH